MAAALSTRHSLLAIRILSLTDPSCWQQKSHRASSGVASAPAPPNRSRRFPEHGGWALCPAQKPGGGAPLRGRGRSTPRGPVSPPPPPPPGLGSPSPPPTPC